MNNNNEKYKINAVKREKRIPIHEQNALTAEKKEGYVRRIVNEEAGRVDMFKKAGWEIVEGHTQNISDHRMQNASQLGSEVRFVVNRDPMARSQTAVLMEIPEEHYNEDFLAQQDKIKQIEKTLDPKNQQQRGADYGTMSIDSGIDKK